MCKPHTGKKTIRTNVDGEERIAVSSGRPQQSGPAPKSTEIRCPPPRRRRGGGQRANRRVAPAPMSPRQTSGRAGRPRAMIGVPAMPGGDACFAMDCEMVGVGPGGLESSLARVTVVNFDNEVILDTYVRQSASVTDYRTFVSGVRREDVESEEAISKEECRSIVRSILQGKILVGHGLENDLKALDINHPYYDVRDTASYPPFMRARNVGNHTISCPRKLRDLAWEKLGMQIQVAGRPHSPEEDACAAMDLYKAVRGEWEPLVMHQIVAAMQMEQQWKAQVSRTRALEQPPSSPCGMQNVGMFHNVPHPSHMASHHNHHQQVASHPWMGPPCPGPQHRIPVPLGRDTQIHKHAPQVYQHQVPVNPTWHQHYRPDVVNGQHMALRVQV